MPFDTSPTAHAQRAARFNAAVDAAQAARREQALPAPTVSATPAVRASTPAGAVVTAAKPAPDAAYKAWVVKRANEMMADPNFQADLAANRIVTARYGPRAGQGDQGLSAAERGRARQKALAASFDPADQAAARILRAKFGD